MTRHEHERKKRKPVVVHARQAGDMRIEVLSEKGLFSVEITTPDGKSVYAPYGSLKKALEVVRLITPSAS